MKPEGVFDRTVELIEDRLTINARRQEVIAANISNIDTPGYVSKDLSFEKVLEEAMKPRIRLVSTHPDHIDIPEPTEVVHKTAHNPEVVQTGPVDLEEQMTKLARNNLEYQFLVTMLNKKFALLKLAMSEGGR
ncbi:MAG: flagellar basal body rod protein FlgB [Deltaproteobacteria bacterium]|nr:flagellar basal body rod protein FlgB [Deltaproteobacteria bacterium]MBW2068630.1 flagellar basal body rod protein FlgB [Deltaproteobacteria bacterium]